MDKSPAVNSKHPTCANEVIAFAKIFGRHFFIFAKTTNISIFKQTFAGWKNWIFVSPKSQSRKTLAVNWSCDCSVDAQSN